MATRFAYVDIPVLLVLFVSFVTFHPVFADDDPIIVASNGSDDNSKSVVDPIKSDTDLKYDETGVEKVTYDGAQLFRIKGVDEELRIKLDELEDSGAIETWSPRSSEYDIMVKGDQIDDVSNLLRSYNATFEVVIEDIQRAIKDENPDIGPSEDRQTHHLIFRSMIDLDGNKSNGSYNLTWQRYHRYSDHLQYFSYLAKQYSDFVSVIDVGSSVERRPIKVLKISSGSENPKAMWIDGGTHAREWISPATVLYMVRELVERRSDHIDNTISKRIGSALSNIDFYIAPVLNPDGYEYSHTVDRLWRKNRKKNSYCVGTDLNRNWGYKWGGAGSSKHPCKEIFAGSSAFSEPETRAVSDFILSIKDKLKGFVTFHSYGQYILYPWGYASKVPPDYADLDRVGRKAAAAIQKAGGPAYRVGNSATTLYPASGGADDWAKGAAGIKYTYTFELRDDGRYGFVLPPHFIEPCGKESFAAIKVIAEEINNLA